MGAALDLSAAGPAGTAPRARAVEPIGVHAASLARAFDDGDLMLHYQPQVDISRRWPEIVGYEALTRWPVAGGGFVPPDRFIPVAEESGLLPSLDIWVMETVCTELARLKATGARPGVTMSVNVSPLQFRQPGYAQSVADILSRTGADPAALTLEITERALLSEDETTLSNIRTLSETGVQLSLDDFGTGYSSLSYLRDMPIQEVKLDRCFISGLPRRHRDAAIVNATLTLAADLGLRVVAEGVELAEQAAWLRRKGCPTLQGFLYGRPAARGWTTPADTWTHAWTDNAKGSQKTAGPSALAFLGQIRTTSENPA